MSERARASARLEAKAKRLAEHGPKSRYDDPQAAMEFFLAQRLGPGVKEMPLDQLRETSLQLQQRAAAGRVAGVPALSLDAWSEIGPGNIGGRTRAMVIDPTNPSIVYAAGVAGGVWKSLDAGGTWFATDDFMLNIAVNSLVMDPTDPLTLYAGTGEGFFNSDAVRGLGIFKTIDGGATWSQLAGTVSGVPEGSFYRVNDLVISPASADRVYAGTRFGVWRSDDAGATWTNVLKNPVFIGGAPASNGSSAGCLDVAIRTDTSPGDDVLLAAFGSFGPDGLFRSTDNGTTWTQVGTAGDIAIASQGRMQIDMAPSDNDIVYISMANNLTDAVQNVFRSTDGGVTWSPRLNFGNPFSSLLFSNVPYSNGCFGTGGGGQGWYDNIIKVDPADPDIVWVGGIDLFRSDDGGQNFGLASYWYFDPFNPNYVHADHHALVFHPDYDGTTNQILYSGSDGGVSRTSNARAATSTNGCPGGGGSALPAISWTNLNNGYGVTQFYWGDVAKDGPVFGGGTQDNGTLLVGSTATPNSWIEIFGGDGGYFAIDPTNSQIMYQETQNFPNIRKSTNGGASFFFAASGITDEDGLFITPFEMSQSDPNVLWTGGSRAWRTTNGASSWNVVSPDFVAAGTISAIAIADSDPAVVYLGYTNGVVARTTNGLDPVPAWTVFEGANGLNSGSYVSGLAIDPIDPDLAYATYSTFGVPHILRTTNGGLGWSSIDGIAAAGVPDIPVHHIAIRPCDSTQLFAATELGVFISGDNGASWTPANLGLANTVVEKLDFQNDNTLIAFTHGRGTFVTTVEPSCANLRDGLTGYYPCNNDVLDYSGNGRDLSLHGGLGFAGGLLLEGLDYNGNDAQSVTGADAVWDFLGNDFSVQLWVNFDTVAGEQTLIEKWTGSGGAGWTLTKLSNNVLRFHLDVSFSLDVVSGFTTSQWHHVVVTRNGSSLETWIDGQLAGSVDAAGEVADAVPEPLLIGRRDGPQVFPLLGGVDEVALWSRGLGANEIAQLYNGGDGLDLQDCNGNGVADGIDIATLFSQDCNSDGTPDECQAVECGRTCDTAVAFACGDSVEIDNSSESLPPNPAYSCGFDAFHTGTLWYEFVATGSDACFSSCDSVAQDSTFAIYSGACGALTEIGCAEDNCGISGFLGQTCVVGLTPGETYYVQFSAWDATSRGQFTLDVTCDDNPPCADLPLDDMVSWWPGEVDGSDVIDGNDASLLNGAAVGPAYVGNGFVLDGIDDTVAVPSPMGRDGTWSSMTIECWVRSNGTQGAPFSVLVDASHGGPSLSGWVMEYDNNNQLMYWEVAVPGSGYVPATASIDLGDGEFHHVAGTFDGTDSRLYLDGVPVAVVNAAGGIASNMLDINIGWWWGGGSPGRYFNGIVDEVTLYDRALTDVEIAAIAGARVTGKCFGDCDDDGTPDAVEIAECDGDPACADCDENGLPDGCEIEPVLYAYDDGTPESQLGLNVPREFVWMNSAVVQAGGQRVSAIDVMFTGFDLPNSQGLPVGTPIQVVLWSDPNDDGNPSDAQTLQVVSTEIARIDNVYGRYPVPVTEVGEVGETFYFGVVATVESQFPARVDESVTSDASWAAAFEVGSLDLNDLSGAILPPLPLVSVGPGTFMVRAIGVDPDCTENSVLDVCDIALGEPDGNGNGIPEICECLPTDAPLAVLSEPQSRYITIEPQNAGGMTALRVTFDELHAPDPAPTGTPDFSSFNGEARWVGPPLEYPEGASAPPSFFAATLQCDPHFADWSEFGTISIYGDAVVPSSAYTIQAIDQSCSAAIDEANSYSTGLEMTTSRWGDVAEPFQPPSEFAQPNITDILAIVDKFLGAFPPLKASTQLLGNEPDPSVKPDLNDILLCVDSFLGQAYPYAGPSVCP